MKHFLYVLFSSREHKRHYIGMSANPDQRLSRHNSGKVFSTKPYRPYVIVYREELESRMLARAREVFLKKNAEARKKLFDSIGAIV